jgi:hypothetical protein
MLAGFFNAIWGSATIDRRIGRTPHTPNGATLLDGRKTRGTGVRQAPILTGRAVSEVETM